MGWSTYLILICGAAWGEGHDASFWIKEGNDQLELENYELAISCYDKAIEMDTNSSLAWNKKGLTLFNLFDKTTDKMHIDYAIKCYDQAINIDPFYSEAWTSKGKALLKLASTHNALDKLKNDTINREYVEALECFKSAIAIDALDADAWYNKGFALHELGDMDEARKSFSKAEEIDPNYPYLTPILYESSSTTTEESYNKWILILLGIFLILLYNNFKIGKPSNAFITDSFQKYLVMFNLYIPINIFKFFKLSFLAIILTGLIFLMKSQDIMFTIFVILLIILLFLSIVGIGLLITLVFWLLFSSPFTPCGHRARWAEFEQQMKNKALLYKLEKTFIILAFITYIIMGVFTSRNLDFLSSVSINSFLNILIIAASITTVMPSVTGVLLSINLDQQTAKSVFISQFGLAAVNGVWLSMILSNFSLSFPSLRWAKNLVYVVTFIIIFISFIFLFIPYLQGLRRAEKHRERLYAARQSLLERLSGILEVPIPSLYLLKLEDFLKDLEKERSAFIEDDEMVKLGLIWDKSEDPPERPKSSKDFELRIMRQAYHRSRYLDPRFLYIDFLNELEAHVKECREQLDLANQKGDPNLVAAASGYSKTYQAKRDEIIKTIEMERRTRPKWTVAIATIITLIMTPILNELGKLISARI